MATLISSTNVKRLHGPPMRCCSRSPEEVKKTQGPPPLVKVAVSGATELLRLFSSSGKNRLNQVSYNRSSDETSVSSVDDVAVILKSDYENAYFVTGIFTSAIYADDCVFEDPTISFQGTELYGRNLKLLVPFFDQPSITLQKIEKNVTSQRNYIQATWTLRTYLKLPWKPLISINGSTVYEMDDNLKIVRHTEGWDVSALEAIGQIFTPTFK